MSFQQRDNSAALFKNERKTEAKHPDYTGNGMVNGAEVELSAWIKEGRNGGKKFMSIAFKPKRQRAQSAGNTGGGSAPF